LGVGLIPVRVKVTVESFKRIHDYKIGDSYTYTIWEFIRKIHIIGTYITIIWKNIL